MNDPSSRRKFLTSVIGIPSLASAGMILSASPASAADAPASAADTPTPSGRSFRPAGRLKTSLNAFCFNDALLAGTMTVCDTLDFCAVAGFEGIDITGYYLKGYPQPPADEYLFEIKRKAFGLGIVISGTGVRNDFTIPDKGKRELEVKLVKNWIEVEADTDMNKLLGIIGLSGYKGYLPIETLGQGDPKTKVLSLLAKLQKSMASS